MPNETEPQAPALHRYARVAIGTIALVAIIAGVVYLFATYQPPSAGEPSQSLSEAIRTGEAPRPPLTQETQAKLAASTGFHALVSYTDRGFEPATIAVRRGETVRFTNNSSSVLRLGVNTSDAMEYDIAPQRNAQITFTESGIFSYTDQSSAAAVSIRVE